ncbi:hypothetical protein [Polaromonas sp.]|uniref:hypothetical protein n=1 Tax=Polaromonas sp. TaxID=1869339 RepID=UPI003BAD7456
MQLVRYADTELQTRGINHRVGTFRYKDLGEGEPGTPGNFFLRLVWSQTDFFSPRHLHNFDQVRVQIQGEFDFATDGVMKPGAVAYFPEGTPYGPQTSQDETIQLVLQIGGPSGAGYMSEVQRVAAVDALAKVGRFSEGRYFAPGDTGSTGMDSLQAAWEYAQGRKMVYPPQRFQKPVLMNPEALAWQAGCRGIERRQVWDFGGQTVAVAQYRLAAASTLELEGPLSCFVEQGAGQVQAGGATGQHKTFEPFDVVHLKEGETVTLKPQEPAKLLVFAHPVFETSP